MNNRPSRSKTRSSRSRNERGITLVTTLLLLLLLIGMSLTMVLAVSSESLINGFYGRYRGSFYAADSGVAASRQQLMNLLGAERIRPAFNPAAAPIANPTTAGANAALALNFAIRSYTNVNSADSWQERFLVKQAFVAQTPNTQAATCTVQGGHDGGANLTSANPTQTHVVPDYGVRLIFPVHNDDRWPVAGQRSRHHHRQRHDHRDRSDIGPPTYNQSFAAWGMFIGTYALAAPATSFPAPSRARSLRTVHGTSATPDPTPSPTRSARWAARPDGITAAVKPPRLRRTASSRRSTAASTFLVNQPAVTLPQNSFNQEQAVLDGIGVPPCPTCAPNLSSPAANLRNAAGAAYPSVWNCPAPAYIFLIRLPAPRPSTRSTEAAFLSRAMPTSRSRPAPPQRLRFIRSFRVASLTTRDD